MLMETQFESIEMGNCLAKLACVSALQGNYQAALDNYQQALQIWLKTYGEKHESIAGYYSDIANILSEPR